MGLDANALLAEIGREAAETTETDPRMIALGEALAYPLRMGRATTSDETAAAIQAETGLPAMMIDGLVSWGMGRAAQAVKDAPDAEAWEYVSRLVVAVAAVKEWEPADVADGIARLTFEAVGRPPAPELYRAFLDASSELERTDPQMPDGDAEYSGPDDPAPYAAADELATGTGEIDAGGE